MEEHQKTSLFSKIQPLLKKKYLFVLLGAIVLLIGISGFLFSFIVSNNNPQKSIYSAPTQAAQPTPNISLRLTPTTSASTTQSQVGPIIKTQLDQRVTIPYTFNAEKIYEQNWAIVEVTSPNTDPARIITQRINGNWEIKLGPGTYFSEDQLVQIGAPQTLINEVSKAL